MRLLGLHGVVHSAEPHSSLVFFLDCLEDEMFLSTVFHSGRLQPPQTPGPPPSSCGSGNVAASAKGSQTGQETQAVRQSNQVLTVPLPHQHYLEEEINVSV